MWRTNSSANPATNKGYNINTMETVLPKTADRSFALDTTFVLFFLAVDFGQGFQRMGFDTVLSLLTLGMLLVLPYFLPSDMEKPDFTPWVLGRAAIAAYATVLGIMFGQSLGVLLPQTFGYLPMTLVIVTAIASCCLQLCAMIKFRLAR